MKTKSLLARAAAAATTVAVGLAGALVVTEPAQAAFVETDYGFSGFAFGTSARADQVGLGSGFTAFSFMGCTRLAGKKHAASLVAANAPANTPMLSIGAVDSVTSTFKEGAAVGTRSTNRVAKVVLGSAEGPSLEIRGLETATQAWADGNGKFHANANFKLGDIVANTGTPLDQLNDVTKNLFAQLAAVLQEAGGALSIPGLGRIALGKTDTRVRATRALADAQALQILLYGANGVAGGGDDIKVVVGRSLARIFDNMEAGVMRGASWAADVTLLDGILGVQRVARRPLPCQGTNGKVLENNIAGLNLLNLSAIQAFAASSRVYGVRGANSTATAWTEGRVARVSLGSGDTALEIKGIVGRANVKRGPRGRIFRSIKGTQIASITVGGEVQELPKPGESIEIPGLATIKFGVVSRPNKRAISVISVQILLVPDVQQESGVVKIDLGVAKVALNRT